MQKIASRGKIMVRLKRIVIITGTPHKTKNKLELGIFLLAKWTCIKKLTTLILFQVYQLRLPRRGANYNCR